MPLWKKKGSIITLAAKIVIDLLAIQNDIRSADQPGRPRHEPVNHKVEWSWCRWRGKVAKLLKF